jgi:cytochrome c-type biogenesis protein CcmH
MRNGVYVLATAAIMLAAAAPDPVRRIEERFLAPCCWRESVAVHQSPKAEELRAEIQQMVAAKKSEAEIVDHYVALYGERILREPRGLRSLWLMIVPLVVLVGGGAALAVYLRHASRAALADGSATP